MVRPISEPVQAVGQPAHTWLADIEARLRCRRCGNRNDNQVLVTVSSQQVNASLNEKQARADGLRALFTTWITFPQPDLDVLVPAVLASGAVAVWLAYAARSGSGY